jgi:hypothetical protein
MHIGLNKQRCNVHGGHARPTIKIMTDVSEEVAKTRKLIAAQPEARLANGFQSGDSARAPPDGGAS